MIRLILKMLKSFDEFFIHRVFFRLAAGYPTKKQNKNFNYKLKIVNASLIIQKFVTR